MKSSQKQYTWPLTFPPIPYYIVQNRQFDIYASIYMTFQLIPHPSTFVPITPPLLTHAFDLLTPRPRWLKYEEKVEAGERWSKPHVPTTALHALFEIRKSISDGTAQVLLDLDNSHGCIHQVAGWQCKHYELFKSILPEC